MTESASFLKRHRVDIIIVTVIVVVALVILGVRIQKGSQDGNVVYVTGADGFHKTFDLDEDTRYTVTTDLGVNTIVIENGTVHIEDADCPDKLCEQQGTIDSPGQTLICLPHELVVEILAPDGETDTEYDNISR